MFKHILIPTDGSRLSRKAATAGIAFAKSARAKVTVYHALETQLPYLVGDGVVIDAGVIDALEKNARKQGEAYVAAAAQAAKTARVTCATLLNKPATPAQGIVDAARRKKCDAIFIGSHGRGGVASLILGSVTQQVLAHSKIPVIVYR
jgi:nucleotide-binding universal stress UspA family protein